MEHEEIIPNKGNYGTLRWGTKALNPKDKTACFFGRLVALYDYKNDYFTETEKIENAESRVYIFRMICHWIAGREKKVRCAYRTIGMDCPGVNAEMISGQINMDEFNKWYNFEYDHLNGVEKLFAVIRSLWGGRKGIFCADVNIPFHESKLWRDWVLPLGDDIINCLDYACEKAGEIALEDIPEIMDIDRAAIRCSIPEVAAARKVFVAAWKEKEAELLATPPDKRGQI